MGCLVLCCEALPEAATVSKYGAIHEEQTNREHSKSTAACCQAVCMGRWSCEQKTTAQCRCLGSRAQNKVCFKPCRATQATPDR